MNVGKCNSCEAVNVTIASGRCPVCGEGELIPQDIYENINRRNMAYLNKAALEEMVVGRAPLPLIEYYNFGRN